jgi:DNA-binding MarR family transcriptional regulator
MMQHIVCSERGGLMTDKKLIEQAEAITVLLPKLMRRMFTTDLLEGPALELPLAQLRVCGILRKGPRTMSCLSKCLGISLSAVTQLADRLERSGMVERTSESDDRRSKCLQLTPYGQEFMHARKQRRIESVLKILERLSLESREEVILSLNALLDAITVHEEEVPDLIPMPSELESL